MLCQIECDRGDLNGLPCLNCVNFYSKASENCARTVLWYTQPNLIEISPFISLSVVFVVHERQKQTESELKGLILIRLHATMQRFVFV